MPIKSIHDLDLSAKPGKVYWKNGSREWREEFIYFLLSTGFMTTIQGSRYPVAASLSVMEAPHNFRRRAAEL